MHLCYDSAVQPVQKHTGEWQKTADIRDLKDGVPGPLQLLHPPEAKKIYLVYHNWCCKSILFNPSHWRNKTPTAFPWNSVQYIWNWGGNTALPSSMASSTMLQGNISGEFFHCIDDILIKGKAFKTVLSNGHQVISVLPQPELINLKPANQHKEG